jgi:hypothetical protein
VNDGAAQDARVPVRIMNLVKFVQEKAKAAEATKQKS